MANAITVEVNSIGSVLFERSKRARRVIISIKPFKGVRISVLHRYLEGLHFSRLEGSGKKQVVANSLHRKDYPYSLLFD